MFFKKWFSKEKSFYVSYSFKDKNGLTGYGYANVTVKDGIFKPGEAIRNIKEKVNVESVVILFVTEHEGWEVNES